MIVIDRALQARAEAGNPIRLAIVGAGTMGRAIANQVLRHNPGIRLVAIANRTLENATRAYVDAGHEVPRETKSVSELEDAIRRGTAMVTDDYTVVCDAEGIDVVLEVTGHVEYSAHVVTRAIERGKNVILMNAELDATAGPILKRRADRAGVVYSTSDGDQPGVILNLYRYVKSIGMTPLLCGNIKGLQDRTRTPETQAAFAQRWKQGVEMVTSFADGTKISFEQTVVANATGMRVAKRGMLGYHHDGHVDELTQRFDIEWLKAQGGIVDYVVGAKPAPGVFVFASQDDPLNQHLLELYKLGEGPLYSFYTPYHLCHFEVPLSVARVVLFRDSVGAPRGRPVVEVVATAKRDLAAGEILDGIGCFMTYGQCENAEEVRTQGLLPMGVAEGCRLKRPVARDEVLRYEDVELPAGRLIDRLRVEQDALFSALESDDTPNSADNITAVR